MKTNRLTNLRIAMMTISELKSEELNHIIDAVKERQKELNTLAGAAASTTGGGPSMLAPWGSGITEQPPPLDQWHPWHHAPAGIQ